MEALDEGERRENVAKRFKIGKTTLYEWQKRRKETGDFQSKKPGNVGYNYKITDWNHLPNLRISTPSQRWPSFGSRQTIHRALKIIGFTRKKRHLDIKKEMRKSELTLQRL